MPKSMINRKKSHAPEIGEWKNKILCDYSHGSRLQALRLFKIAGGGFGTLKIVGLT